jgi:hypothetical protein
MRCFALASGLFLLAALVSACGEDAEPRCDGVPAPHVTSPLVTWVSPGAAAGEYTLTFDQPMDGVDDDALTLTATGGGATADTRVEVVPEEGGASYLVRFHTAGREVGDSFTLRVPAGLAGTCGVLPADVTISVATQVGEDRCDGVPAPHVTSPLVTWVSPGAAAGEYTLTFDQPMNGIDDDALTLTAAGGGATADTRLEVVPEEGGASYLVRFHTAGWEAGESFTLRVPAGLAGTCGALPADVAITVATQVGEDRDEHEVQPALPASYALPSTFSDSLGALGLDAEDLYYPNVGADFPQVATRLAWTDLLRAQPDRAPTFAFMVAESAQGTLTASGARSVGWRLLAAQSAFNHRGDDASVLFRRMEYDVATAVIDADRPLMDALARFYAHAPVAGNLSPPSTPWAEVEARVGPTVAAWPYRARIALAQTIDALVLAASLRDAALSGHESMTMEDWRQLHEDFSADPAVETYTRPYGVTAHARFDFEAMMRAGQLAMRAVESLRDALAAAPPVPGEALDLVGPLGRIVVSLGDSDDVWEGDNLFLLVDRAGDDVYRGHIAANTSFDLPVSIALDVAGNDRFEPDVAWTIDSGAIAPDATRMQGAALFGVAILVDAAGDDDYFSAGFAQGAAFFGVGALLDHGGNDRYNGYLRAQGSAEHGWALLADLGSGADDYTCYQKSGGFGGPRGVGWLVDDGGDDSYLAISEPIIAAWVGGPTNSSASLGFGWGDQSGVFDAGKPVLSGGLGALVDLGGNDTYTCAVFCLGGGYAWGTGVLFDAAGDDSYRSTHKYAMGAGVHKAVGVLVDADGADAYDFPVYGEGLGLGHDLSVGWFLDLGTEADQYSVNPDGMCLFGCARILSFGVFVDAGGNDGYHFGSRWLMQGFGVAVETDDDFRTLNRTLADVVNLGLFLDLGGPADTYDGRCRTAPSIGNGVAWRQTLSLGGGWSADLDIGYGVDVE